MAEVNVGDQAPDFTLPGVSGEDWSLGSVRGSKNLLISFHVLDFTGSAERG